jgi:hypothetical protein
LVGFDQLSVDVSEGDAAGRRQREFRPELRPEDVLVSGLAGQKRRPA